VDKKNLSRKSIPLRSGVEKKCLRDIGYTVIRKAAGEGARKQWETINLWRIQSAKKTSTKWILFKS